MSNKITITKPATLTVSPGIHPIDGATYNEHHYAGAWNFKPLTEEQISKARRDFVRSCAGTKQDAKISEALSAAIQAPMDQAAMTAAVEQMKIEVTDSKVPALEEPELFKRPGVDEPLNIEFKFTYQHMPFITAPMLRDKKAQMADCKLNGVTVKNMTLAEFQAVWAQQIEDQEQRGAKRLMLDRLEATVQEERVMAISRAQIENPCAEITLGKSEPDVLTSALAEKEKRLSETLNKLVESQTLNESEKFELEQHLVGLRASLDIRKRDNRLANDARHAKYEEFMQTQAQERKQDIQRQEELVQEMRTLEQNMKDMRPKGESIKPQKVWVDTEADCVIVKKAMTQAVSQAEDRIRRHWKAYDPPKSVALGEQPCPDCDGSGEYVGFNHAEICPSCKGSKVV